MAFVKLQGLGEEKFTRIVNLLLRGEPATKVAREILFPPPKGWGEFQGMSEMALAQQLVRLRTAVAAGMFGKKYATALAKGHTPHIEMLEKVSVSALDRMEELANFQRDRVLEMRAKEKENLMPQISAKMAPQEYRHILTQTNAVFNDYRETLVTLQDIRFKLGLDEFKGPVNTIKGASQTTTYPDGLSVQKQVFEAVATVERIFDARRIKPHVSVPDPVRHADV